MPDPERVHRVVLFGATDCGKSSIVNLLAEKQVANVSTGLEGTKRAQWYPISLGEKKFRLWDTMGFNQAEAKDINPLSPYEQAHALLRNLQEGVDLILLCARRDGIDTSLRSLYWLLDNFFFHHQARIALVLTHFDAPDEQWWNRNKNTIAQKCKIQIDSLPHACITTVRSGSNWNQSKRAMEDLLLNHVDTTPTPLGLDLSSNDESTTSATHDLCSNCPLSDSDAKILVEKFKLSKRSFRAILFGEAGVGKSSIINLIFGESVAPVSHNIKSCTLDSCRYEVHTGLHQFHIWDTMGLNNTEIMHSSCGKALENAANLARELHKAGGVDLLVFCKKAGRLSDTERKSLMLFREYLCESQTPVSFIVTGLENFESDPMDNWWKDNEEDLLEFCNLEPSAVVGHACITSLATKNPSPQLQERLAESRQSVLTMLEDSITHRSSFTDDEGTWIMSFLRKMIVGMIPVGNPSWWQKLSANTLKDRCGLTKEQAEELNALLYKRRTFKSDSSNEAGDDDLLEVKLPPTTLAAEDQFNYDEAPSPASSFHHEEQVPLPVSSNSTSQPPVSLMASALEVDSETPEIRSEKHNDSSAPPSRFLRILKRWKKSIREHAVPEPRHVVGVESRSADNVNASNRAFSTMAEARSQPRTVQKLVEQKKSKASPRAGGDRHGDRGTSAGGCPPDPKTSSKAGLPSNVVDGGHGGSTSAGGHPLDPQPSSGAQQANDADQPSTCRIDLRQELGKATLSIAYPTWLCCCSEGTTEQ